MQETTQEHSSLAKPGSRKSIHPGETKNGRLCVRFFRGSLKPSNGTRGDPHRTILEGASRTNPSHQRDAMELAWAGLPPHGKLQSTPGTHLHQKGWIQPKVLITVLRCRVPGVERYRPNFWDLKHKPRHSLGGGDTRPRISRRSGKPREWRNAVSGKNVLTRAKRG